MNSMILVLLFSLAPAPFDRPSRKDSIIGTWEIGNQESPRYKFYKGGVGEYTWSKIGDTRIKFRWSYASRNSMELRFGNKYVYLLKWERNFTKATWSSWYLGGWQAYDVVLMKRVKNHE